jgi:hypothetical protein
VAKRTCLAGEVTQQVAEELHRIRTAERVVLYPQQQAAARCDGTLGHPALQQSRAVANPAASVPRRAAVATHASPGILLEPLACSWPLHITGP